MKCVIIESPFAGKDAYERDRNLRYLRDCLHDSLMRAEAPFASHAIYTQPGVLDDNKPDERMHGIEAGFEWGGKADLAAVYTDLGMSEGMKAGVQRAKDARRPIEYRSLPAWKDGDPWSILPCCCGCSWYAHRKMTDGECNTPDCDCRQFVAKGPYERLPSRIVQTVASTPKSEKCGDTGLDPACRQHCTACRNGEDCLAESHPTTCGDESAVTAPRRKAKAGDRVIIQFPLNTGTHARVAMADEAEDGCVLVLAAVTFDHVRPLDTAPVNVMAWRWPQDGE